MAILIGIVAAIMPDLGNATILFLTVVIMIAVSGIGYRWFLRCWGAIVSVSGLVLASIWLIGVERVAKIPVFGYVACASVLSSIPSRTCLAQATNWLIPTML